MLYLTLLTVKLLCDFGEHLIDKASPRDAMRGEVCLLSIKLVNSGENTEAMRSV
jgi:hypothetical protein